MFCLFLSAVVREMVLGAVLEIPEFHLADHLREYFFIALSDRISFHLQMCWNYYYSNDSFC